MCAFTFKLKHNINHVLKNFRSGNHTILGNVPDYKYRDVFCFCNINKKGCGFAKLRYRSRRAFNIIAMNRLNRINHYQLGLFAINNGLYYFKICFRKNIKIFKMKIQSVASHFYLQCRFLSAYI